MNSQHLMNKTHFLNGDKILSIVDNYDNFLDGVNVIDLSFAVHDV